ncbi:MAG TPA: DUF6159 family protein [Steroidobacteraceae bacterium]|nr:DUF6159 family protein [Steroidobacteraceae bacterium]
MSYGHSFSDRLDISVGLFKASSAILLKNRSLLLFPLISALAALLVLVSFAWPSGGMRALTTLVPDGKAFTNSHYAAYFLFYLCEYFVVFFFNTALVGAVMRQLDGEEATFTDGLRIAASKLYTIFGYALISATVGVVLQAIEERSGWLGRIVASLLGTTWTLATYFVVPVLAANDVGPIEAVKESARLFTRTWGEMALGVAGMGLTFAMLFLLVLAGGAGLTELAKYVLQSELMMRVMELVTVGAIATLLLIFSSLSRIYAVALYRYASDSGSTAGFDSDALALAFYDRR